MGDANDRVSVIITCYNQAHFLSEAIGSVLAQTHPRFEVIVVDDGSADDPAQVAARYPQVRFIRQQNQGVSAARNAGLRQGKGDYIQFLDADDRLLPRALEIGVSALREQPACAFAYGHAEMIDGNGAPLPPVERPYVEHDHYPTWLARYDIWSPGQVLYRRAVFDPPGHAFAHAAGNAADLELNLRISRENPVLCHNQVVLQYRLHEANTSRQLALMLKSCLDVYRLQREYVKGRRHLEAVYKVGLNRTRKHYGERLLDQLGTDIRAGEWEQTARDAWALLRHYPDGLARRLMRKLEFVKQGARKQP